MFACYLQPHNFDINLVNTVNQAKWFDIRKVGRFKWPTREAINQMTDNTQGELSKEKGQKNLPQKTTQETKNWSI
jgi:CRISPR/Cas system CMR-associated protein Cmr1 (group 7 of RAMP superfamily)